MNRLKRLLPYLLVLGLVGSFFWAIAEAPRLMAPGIVPAGTQVRASFELEARKTLAQIVGGTALVVGLYFTWRTQRNTEGSQITDRFAKALSSLGGTDETQKIGGAYVLERIARDSTRDRKPIIDILCSVIRAHERTERPQYRRLAGDRDTQAIDFINRFNDASGWTPEAPPHITACVTALCRLLGEWPTFSAQVDLSQADLRRLRFAKAHLRHANLYLARCERSTFEGADLRDTDLRFASFKQANLGASNLDRAAFVGADFSWSDLRNARLRKMAPFHEPPNWTVLGFSPDATSDPSDVDGEARPARAKATFDNADLRGADLHQTPLDDISFLGTDLSLTRGLTSDNLRKARGDSTTELPVEIVRPEDWPTA